MTETWNEGVRGAQLLPLINSNSTIIRCVAGPGTGKTFGLVRRVERIVHPDGLGIDGQELLVVAFNRVIAKQLQADISERTHQLGSKKAPVIRTIHALCADVLGEKLRMLLPFEVDAMLYDVLEQHTEIAARYGDFKHAKQALREHEANHAEHLLLWQASQRWLMRHEGHLVSDLPRQLLERLKGGDFPDRGYQHVVVDEFQDLTKGEQDLMFRLRRPGGSLVALGDPRQSIYAFRGNDREGLARLELLAGDGDDVTDVPVTACHRCPAPIVSAANQLMALSGIEAMVPASDASANLHVVTWDTPDKEAIGMANAIVKNIAAYPEDRHLVMVTRRSFGYALRDAITETNPDLPIQLGFSEGLLEEWAVREAFLMFCLLVDPDPATWRAWLACKNSPTGKNFGAPKRNAAAYLRFLTRSGDAITAATVEALAAEPRTTARGAGGEAMWERACRFRDLRAELSWDGQDAEMFVESIFNREHWIGPAYDKEKADSAMLDLDLLREKTRSLLEQEREHAPTESPIQHLRAVAQRLRHHIATQEPLDAIEARSLQVATLWGAKGVTAEHVYVLGACEEALPGERRPEYPGTEAEFVDEQRRLFYVTLTRTRSTLVISRAQRVARNRAKKLGLSVTTGTKYHGDLKMSPFFRDIMNHLPPAVSGPSWGGCAPV